MFSPSQIISASALPKIATFFYFEENTYCVHLLYPTSSRQHTTHAKSELNLFRESVRFQSFSAQFQCFKCSRFFVCVTASLTIFILQGWRTKLIGPCLGPPWEACSWPPRPALTLRAKPAHRLPHQATAVQTMILTS